MKEPRVIEIIENYSKGNLKQVSEYLMQPDMIVDPNTWAGQLKKLIEDEEFFTAKTLIETTAYKFIKIK
jgi:hypothetical protein